MPQIGQRYAKALITGAGSGLGKAFSDALIEEGVHVWGTSRQPENLVASDFFSPVELNLSNQENLRAWFNRLDNDTGGIDLVINNAGFAAFGEFANLSPEDIKDQFQVLLSAPIQLAQAAAARFRERDKGCLVNVSSVAGELWIPYLSVYNASKAGLSAFSQSLMLESPGTAPWIIDFRPGDYRTEFNKNVRQQSFESSSVAKVWQRLQDLLDQSPVPARAADDLLRAINKFSHCTCYSGSFFQTRIAPLACRLSSMGLKRAILRRYFR